MVGVTQIGSAKFNTTGVLGYSGRKGARTPVAFPGWATVPGYQDLADSRHWHFFFAWLFVINGLTYWIVGLINGHIVKDLAPTGADLKPKNVWHEIVTHARLRFPKGEEARHYNVLQKGAYLAVVADPPAADGADRAFAWSPGFDAGAPWLVDLFGGRQSRARTIHFLTAFSIVGFVGLHLFMVAASGTRNNVRSM